jgi:hypothetical protein
VKEEAGPAQLHLLDKLGATGWRVYVDPSDRLNFIMRDPTQVYFSPAVGSVSSGDYHHVMFFGDRDEASNNGFRAYVDGVDIGGRDISSAPGALDSFISLSVGGEPVNVTRFGDQIAFVQLWRAPGWHPGGPANLDIWGAIAQARAAEVMT